MHCTDETGVVRLDVRARLDGARGGAVRDFYGFPATNRVFLRHRFTPAPSRPFHVRGAMRSFPGLGLSNLACSASVLERTNADLQDDDLLLNVTLEGQRSAWHCGREVVFGQGEALLSTGSQASKNAFSDTRFISFRVPFKPVAAMVPDVEDHLCRPIRRDVAPLRLLASYGSMLMADTTLDATPKMQHLLATHVYDLLALTLGAGRDATELARSRGGQAAWLRAVTVEATQNTITIGDTEVSLSIVAGLVLDTVTRSLAAARPWPQTHSRAAHPASRRQPEARRTSRMSIAV